MKSNFIKIVLFALLGAAPCLPLQAASDRAKKAAGVLVGGGVGGTLAGVAGSAKWAPLGIVGGAIIGGLLARSIIKNRRRKAAERQQQAGSPYAIERHPYRYQKEPIVTEPHFQEETPYLERHYQQPRYINQYGKSRKRV